MANSVPPSSPEPASREPSPIAGGLVKFAALLQLAALIGLILLLLEPVTKTPVAMALVPNPTNSTNAAPVQPAAPAVSALPIMPTLPLKYPASRTVDASDTIFGVKVDDPYRWLEDGKSPEVQAWLADENKLTRSYLDALPGRAALEKRYPQLLRIDTISAPGRSGDRYFYMKRKAEQEKAILYWRSATDPNEPEHVLIDPNVWIGDQQCGARRDVDDVRRQAAGLFAPSRTMPTRRRFT